MQIYSLSHDVILPTCYIRHAHAPFINRIVSFIFRLPSGVESTKRQISDKVAICADVSGMAFRDALGLCHRCFVCARIFHS